MKLNPKITWGLAWAGLALVLIVPSADYLTGKLGDGSKAAVLTSTTEPVQPSAADTLETASVTTTVTPKGITITPKGTAVPASSDPVDKYLESGKTLPDYISDGNTTAAMPASASTAPTQVAALDPKPVATSVAPTPFPSWARPTTSVPSPASDAVVIVDDSIYVDEAAISDDDVPVYDSAPAYDDQGSWDDESLREYLERRGILEGGDVADRSSASVTVRDRDSECDAYDEYDPDGFYLSEGPNSDCDRAAARQARLDALFGDDPSF